MKAILTWRELNVPLKVTVLTGISVGIAGIAANIDLQQLPVDQLSAPPIGSLILIGSILVFAGSFSILTVPMRSDRRDILGFVTFTGSILLLLITLGIWSFLVQPPPT